VLLIFLVLLPVSLDCPFLIVHGFFLTFIINKKIERVNLHSGKYFLHYITASIDKSTFTPDDCISLDTDYIIVKKPLVISGNTRDACTQTEQMIKSPKNLDQNKVYTHIE
jgi:hypothetical protein